MRILLVRHAETDRAGTFCGHSDPPLNQRGFDQVGVLVEELASAAIEVVYSSDLRRAAATAEAIAESHEVAVVVLPALREIFFGEWEELTWAEIEQRDAGFAQRWVDEFPRLAAPGGETFEDFEQRVLRAFDSIVKGGKDAAIVAHAGVIRVILRARFDVTEEDAWARTKGYCSVSRFAMQGVVL